MNSSRVLLVNAVRTSRASAVIPAPDLFARERAALLAAAANISRPAREELEVQRCPEPQEQSTLNGYRDRAAAELDRAERGARAILNALERIEYGTYGICVECEEPISAKRLAAMPAAALCAVCQERLESMEPFNDRRTV